ncbi:MAG: sugar phosphate isomerase/epimerase family protein [Candidatus Bathyarchaeia archaeon]
MKYSVSNWIYGDEPLDRTLERLSRLGYDGVELKGAPGDYDIGEVRDLLSTYNLEVSSICGIWPWDSSDHMKSNDLANPDVRVRMKAIKYVKDCLELGRDLGASCMVVVVGGCGKTMRLHEDEWVFGIESVREAGRYAEDVGVALAIEPINRYELSLMNNVDQGLRFVKDVNMDSVKLMLDTFHMNIEEADPAAAVRKAGEYLIHLHVADSNRQSVGRGHTDFKSIVKALKDIGYQRYLAMEPLPPTSADVYDLNRLDRGLFDLYAEECITMLKFYERVT